MDNPVPQNVELERLVLGAILLDGGALRSAAEILAAADFYDAKHRELFRAMVSLAVKKQAVDTVTILEELKRSKAVSDVAGAQRYLFDLTDGVPRVSNVVEWCRLVKDRAVVRNLRAELIAAQRQCEEGEPAAVVVAGVNKALEIARKGGGVDHGRSFRDAVSIGLQELDRFTEGSFPNRVQTGIRTLDQRLRGGMLRGECVLLGAPSGAGKSSVCQQIVMHVARSGPVLFCTPEMGLASLMEREIIRRSGMKLAFRSPWFGAGPLRDAAVDAHGRAAAEIAQEDPAVVVLNSPDVSMSDVEREAMAMPGIQLVVIDYAQHVAGWDDKRPRYLQVGEVGSKAVDLAMKLNIPVLVASQVNVAKSDGGKREYSFRETAILEQKAGVVLILDVEYEDQPDGTRTVSKATVICNKNRGYAQFRLPVSYEPALYSISDLDEGRFESSSTPADLPQQRRLPS